MLMRWRYIALVIGLLLPTALLADEPKQKDHKAEPLPAPKALAPSDIVVAPAYPQPGTREVWQNYGVDSRGRFLPRVMYHSSGSFYLRDGTPYPWTTTRPTLFMPYAID